MRLLCRSVLTALKIKSWQAGSEAGADSLHFYLTGDVVNAEETRQGFNPSLYFVRGIEMMGRVIRDAGRSERGERGERGGYRGGERGGDRGGDRGDRGDRGERGGYNRGAGGGQPGSPAAVVDDFRRRY